MRGAGSLTAEQCAIRDAAREFAHTAVLPLANELDPIKADIPVSLIEQMGDLGYFGLLIPEQLGGLGLGYVEYCLVAEELARAWMSVASLIARGNDFYRFVPGRGEVRRMRIAAMAKGKYLGALAMSEPGAGSDIASIRCRAQRQGDEWVITGSKYWCTFADRADFITVITRTAPANSERPHLGLTAISFHKQRGEFPERLTGLPIPKIGYFGWRTYELAFDSLRVPCDGEFEEGRAFYAIASRMEGARAHTAARSIGLAQGALEDGLAYAQERCQFGRAIAEFQAIRFKLAAMATQIEAARQLLHFVCRELDSGRRCDKEAAMAKLFAAEMSEQVTSEAMQILGGAGYTTLHAVERHWRDARLTKIFEGSSEIQQRIISDALLGKSRN